MPTKTRLTKGKIVTSPEGTLAPAPFPLATWAGGRRRVPSQARSLRTRGVILESARELANSKGVGSVTMQMVAAKAKIAAGTAYQFFDDRDAIFFDLYETWAGAWWSSIMLSTSRPWTAATWADELDAVVETGCKFHLKQKEMWEVIRYVESTKIGRDGMKLLFDDRCRDPLLRHLNPAHCTWPPYVWADREHIASRSNSWLARGAARLG
jgi:AcrR family transcriptional regulator